VEYDPEATSPALENFVTQICGTEVGSVEEQQSVFDEAYNQACWEAVERNQEPPPKPNFQPQEPGTVIFDPDQERLLQEVCGLTIFPRKHFPKIVILLGTGRNGKSTLMSTLEKLIGDGFTKMKVSHFNQRFGRGNLYGKIALFDDDYDFGLPLPVAFLKEISEDKVIESEVKNAGYTQFKTGCTPLINTNKLPHFKDESLGWRDRVLVIPFDRSWTGSNADRGLAAKLEQELPGILNWCLEGLRRVQDRNALKLSQRVGEKTQEMFDSQNSLTSFIRDKYERDPNNYTGTELADFKIKYRAWCAETNMRPFGDRSIRQNLEAMGFTLSTTGGVTYIRNLREEPF
jgi:P4 family phage/plasmid primase-like protien